MTRVLVTGLVLVLLVTAGTHVFVGEAAAEDVTLEITLVDEDGQPVGGVDVSVTWDGGEGGPRTDTTTSDGRALIDVPRGSDVAISIDDDEYVRNRPFRIFDVQGGTVEVPVSESGRATIVVEGPGGPIPSATVDIRSPGGRVDRQTTNENGVARTDPLELGRYTVRVTAPGHLTNETTIEITRVEKTETVRVQRADVDATITVVDDHFQPPQAVSGATVRIERLGMSLVTGSDGTVTREVPVNRDYRVRITKDGYDTETVTVRVGEDPTSKQVAIRRTPSLSVESINDRVVVGESTVVTVTDEYDRRVEGATVSVGGETVGQTGPQGQLRIPIESAGQVTVQASTDETTATITVEGVDPSATPTPTATPESTPTATPESTPTPSPSPTPGEDGPGFGPVVSVLAVLAAGLLVRRR